MCSGFCSFAEGRLIDDGARSTYLDLNPYSTAADLWVSVGAKNEGQITQRGESAACYDVTEAGRFMASVELLEAPQSLSRHIVTTVRSQGMS